MRRWGTSVPTMLAVLALLQSGCSDDDGGFKPRVPQDPTQASPQNTLAKYVLTYQSRDSVTIDQLYDPAYTGSTFDFREPPGSQVLTFTAADEIAHVAALRRATGIQSVTLDLGPQTSWSRLPSDDPSHPEWAAIQLSDFALEIIDGSSFYDASSEPGDLMTFRFSPQLDTTSPTDTTWRIVGWTEIRGANP